jgi:hypothetical protein
MPCQIVDVAEIDITKWRIPPALCSNGLINHFLYSSARPSLENRLGLTGLSESHMAGRCADLAAELWQDLGF